MWCPLNNHLWKVQWLSDCAGSLGQCAFSRQYSFCSGKKVASNLLAVPPTHEGAPALGPIVYTWSTLPPLDGFCCFTLLKSLLLCHLLNEVNYLPELPLWKLQSSLPHPAIPYSPLRCITFLHITDPLMCCLIRLLNGHPDPINKNINSITAEIFICFVYWHMHKAWQ